MSIDSLLTRITVDSAICHGKPCVRGLRYPVEVLEREDLLAVLAYAASLSRTKRLQSVLP